MAKIFTISTAVPVCPECAAGMSRRSFYIIKTEHRETLYICNDGPHIYKVSGPGQAENELVVKKIAVSELGL